MEKVIVCDKVSKVYKQKRTKFMAVNDLSFTVNKNEVIGYIGVNGSGKSTTIKMLTGILLPTQGGIQILGYDPYYERKKILSRIGVVFGQRSQLIWDLPAIDTFKLNGKIYELSNKDFQRNMDLIKKYMNIEDIMHVPVRKMSLGQRMCCEIMAALIHLPEVLFLDEPTIGLDVFNKEKIRLLIKKMKEDFGMSVFLTSHDIKDIEELSDRIIVIDHGKKLYEGTKQELEKLCGYIGNLTINGYFRTNSKLPKWALEKKDVEGSVEIKYKKDEVKPDEILRWISDMFDDINDFSISTIDLEETIKNLYNTSKRMHE